MLKAGPLMAASWTLTAAVLLGVGGGWWLDGRLGTKPWLVLTGTLLGVIVGMYQLARAALRAGQRDGE